MALSLGGGAISADIYTVQYSGDKKTDYTFTAEWKESATPRSTPSSTGRPAVPQTGDGSAPPVPCALLMLASLASVVGGAALHKSACRSGRPSR